MMRFLVRVVTWIHALRRSPPEGSLGRAAYVLIRSGKTNKALLLKRVTEGGAIGRRVPIKLREEVKINGKDNIICKR